jgi:tetratricopeptide (TPR) repeat protein
MTPTQALRRFFCHLGTLAAAALLVTAVGLKPVAVYAMGDESPAPPVDDGKKKDKKKGSVIEQQEQKLAQEKQQEKQQEKFLRDYRAARQLILSGNYQGGIAAMHALGHDEHPDVANYIGYANRKMGHYEQSKIWYEQALAADPNHVRTWSYYGMWQMEQGNRLKAEDFLSKVKLICGNASCEEYRQLKAVIDGRASY